MEFDQEGSSSEHYEPSIAGTHSVAGVSEEIIDELKSNPQLSKGKASPSSHGTESIPECHGEATEEKEEEEDQELRRKLIQTLQSVQREKDLLHLVLSYPMETDVVDDPADLRDLTRCISEAKQLERHVGEKHDTDVFIRKIFEAQTMLDKYNFHMMAYLPKDCSVSLQASLTGRIRIVPSRQTRGTFQAPDEMLTMAINSAIRQVSKCIEDGVLRKIGISGSRGEEVARAVIDLPTVRAQYNDVICVSVSDNDSTNEVRQNITEQINKFQRTNGADKFFLLLDCVDRQIDLHDLEIPHDGFVVLTTQSHEVYEIMDVDLEIRMEHHLLPWDLFCGHVGRSLVNSSSALRQIAVQIVKECHCHLLAIILLARALKNVTDISAWELALLKLTSQSSEQVQGTSHVMKNVLDFIWKGKDYTTKQCIKDCSSRVIIGQCSPVSSWISNYLVETTAKGESVVNDLIRSFLLEIEFGSDIARMRKETAAVLNTHFTSSLPSHAISLAGSGLTETPEFMKETKKINLMKNKLSKLPENPKCTDLRELQLQYNYDLMEIPQLFFEEMPLLNLLDLSHTSIKSLPPSISKLVSLKKFYLRGCELLSELPPQIGALGNLEDFDLQETRITNLPKEIGELSSLKNFKFSLCGRANGYRETKQTSTTIPVEVLPRFSQLEELSVTLSPDGEPWDAEVNPYCEWWYADMKAILKEMSSSRRLKSLMLCLPSVELLQRLASESGDGKNLMYQKLRKFSFTVGCPQQRIINRIPHEVEKLLKSWENNPYKKCLKYINGKGIANEISEALKHTDVFLLDCHWTVKALSDFGHENLVKLESCLLVECNELQTVIDGDYGFPEGVDKKTVLERLEHLSIHYMKNLQSILKGPIYSLSNLTYLALHTCPSLTTIFTPDMLRNLCLLEVLIVEDCPKIKSLVTQGSPTSESGHFLRKLRKIALLDLPELVTISGCLCIGRDDSSLIVYNCPKLETLYTTEMSPKYSKIKGEKEWWDSLKWQDPGWSTEAQPAYKELRMDDEDFMDQLAKDMYGDFPDSLIASDRQMMKVKDR